jgi:putative acetyltransferase
MKDLLIRPYRAEDAAHLARVFHRAVRRGTGAHYSLVQRMAWSPRPGDGSAWHARLSASKPWWRSFPPAPWASWR